MVAPDPARGHALALRMRHQGYRPAIARDAVTAVAEARLGAPDLVVIDPPANEPSGRDTARALRAAAPAAALFVIAGDPCSPGRMRAVRISPPSVPDPVTAPARPVAHVSDERVQVGDLEIGRDSGDAAVSGVDLGLTALEFRLLWTLARATEHGLDRSAIHMAVWGRSFQQGSRVVDVLVRRLRRKVDEGDGAFTYVQTVPGIGYRLQAIPRAICA